jgi:pantoate--beta-alanine ligase
VSLFVNPTQFNNREDFERYPVDTARDLELLASRRVSSVFLPVSDTLYPEGFDTWVSVGALGATLEGEHRPGHFRGMATVVLKLLSLVSPDFAVFGEKDFQQLRIVEQMVSDFNLPITILRGSTVREADGLAMSSRNVRLSKEARAHAPRLYRALAGIYARIKTGEHNLARLAEEARASLAEIPDLVLDYLEVVEEAKLTPSSHWSPNHRLRALVAATVGGIRLIDNLALYEPTGEAAA